MRASVMLEKGSSYQMLDLDDDTGHKLLLLHKVTETGDPFIVVAGYFLREVNSFDNSILAEIEMPQFTEYGMLKQTIRRRLGSKSVPITFW